MSNWKHTQEVNGNLNAQRREISDIVEFVKKQVINEDNHEFIAAVLEAFEAMDKILCEAYLDSGYQYDDNDPRNLMDLHDDNWESRMAARNGTSAEDEMRSEIHREVVKKHYASLSDRLFRELDGFAQWYEERRDILSESWTDERDDDHDW